MAEDQIKKAQGSKASFPLLFAVMLVTGAGNNALQSIVPMIGRTLKIPDSIIATIFSVSALIWVFSAPYWARRSEREGHRKLVLLGLAGFTISTLLVGLILLYALHNTVNTILTVVAIILARALFGIFGSAAPPASQAIVVLATPLSERTKALTLLSSAFGLGTLVGLALAPWMVVPYLGLAGPPLFFTLIGAVVWITAARQLKVDSDGDQDKIGTQVGGAKVSYPSLGGAPAGAAVTAAMTPKVAAQLKLRDPRIWPWMLSGIVMGHAQAMTGASMGFLVIDRMMLSASDPLTQQTIGLVLMAGAGAALLAQWGVIPRLDLRPRKMLLIGLAIASVGVAITAYSTSLYGLAMSYALASIGFGFTRPAFTAGSSLAVGRNLQGLVAGHVTSINGLSFVLAPTIGVVLYEFWKPLPFIVAAVAMFGLIGYALKKIADQEEEQKGMEGDIADC
jgi:MFS family permease